MGLYDRLTLTDAPAGTVALTCTEPALATDDNLVVRAARAVIERVGAARGVRMHLEKAIPVGAGLGGGSSDAAAALKGLDRLWGLGLSREALLGMAAGLGSDVPFFIHGGAARVEGRGERVTPVAPRAGTWALLLHPGVTVRTARVYAAYARETGGRLLTRAAGTSIITDAPQGAESGAAPGNDLEAVACRLAPEIAEAIDALRKAGGGGARMTGSGGVVFCLAESRAALERIHERLKPAPCWKVWFVPLTGAEDPAP